MRTTDGIRIKGDLNIRPPGPVSHLSHRRYQPNVMKSPKCKAHIAPKREKNLWPHDYGYLAKKWLRLFWKSWKNLKITLSPDESQKTLLRQNAYGEIHKSLLFEG